MGANLQNVTQVVPNQKMLSVTLNVRNPNAKLNAQIKVVKCLIALNVSLFANNPIALLTAKPLNQNVNQFAKTPTVYLRLNVVHVHLELLRLLNPSPSLKKLKQINHAANVHQIEDHSPMKILNLLLTVLLTSILCHHPNMLQMEVTLLRLKNIHQ